MTERFGNVVFRTDLPASECVRRLQSKMGLDLLIFNGFTSDDILGWVVGGLFYAYRRRMYRRNSFMLVFYGRVREQEDGSTIIEGVFGWHWLTIIIFAIMLPLLLMGSNARLLLIVTLFLLGIIFLGILFAKSDEAILLHFIERTLKARRV